VITKPGERSGSGASGLWDDEIDGGSPKSSHDASTRLISAPWFVAIGAGGCLAPLLLIAAILGRETAREREFDSHLSAVNRRAWRLGGGVSNGRRSFRYHVGAWFHGKEITDRFMPEIISIIGECQSRGLGGAHLGLDLSRTSIGDEGIALLHSVHGLETVLIRDTDVTEAGVDSLQRALPETRVDAWPIDPAGRAQDGERESKSHKPG
jgi:hypothetical protein